MIKLEISDFNFYSEADELAFDYYLKKISKEVLRKGSKIIVQIDDKDLSYNALVNIFGLKERYGVSILNLDSIITENTKCIIFDESKY